MLFPPLEEPLGGYEAPDFEYILKEIKKKGVTLQLLWEEYSSNKNGYSYSRFCALYQAWKVSNETSMLQDHKAGVDTFIDYAGHTIAIYDPKTGLKEYDAQIFVSALGASSYLYCEATRTQTEEDFLESHKRMNAFYGGVTECWVPDNLKSGVTKADRYEPKINRSYLDLACHHGVSVVPARVRHPKDKSKAEGGVYFIESQILAPLRNCKFYALEELNDAITERLIVINQKPFQKMPGSSRYSFYLEIDKPALKSLPEIPYESFHWGVATVSKNYHITIEQVRYSVPCFFINKIIEFRYNERTVEFFFKGKTIATHMRSIEDNIVTNNNHCPLSHQYQAKCTPEEIKKEAQAIGESVELWVESVFADESLHIRQSTQITLGVVRLLKKYAKERINAACKRGLFYKNLTLKGIKDMLGRDLDKKPLPKIELTKPLPQKHNNVRGAMYYQ
jgi:transposase